MKPASTKQDIFRRINRIVRMTKIYIKYMEQFLSHKIKSNFCKLQYHSILRQLKLWWNYETESMIELYERNRFD